MAWRKTFDPTYDPAKELLNDIKQANEQLRTYVDVQKKFPHLPHANELVDLGIAYCRQLLTELKAESSPQPTDLQS